MSDVERDPLTGTIRQLFRERKRRGRPKRAEPRQTVYVALAAEQKALINRLGQQLPQGGARADVPDLAVTFLALRMENLQRAVVDRARMLPEGMTDLTSLYYLWDLSLPADEPTKWTSIRLSPSQNAEFGRIQGLFNALFNSNRSQVFGLALTLLEKELQLPAAEACQTYGDLLNYASNLIVSDS